MLLKTPKHRPFLIPPYQRGLGGCLLNLKINNEK